jgi:two-component system, chemotaxis family, sensor kinase CheA
MNDADTLWAWFIADARLRLDRITDALAGPSPEPGALRGAAGELFALRTASQLLGIEAMAGLACALERTFDRAAAGEPLAPRRPAVDGALSALRGAVADLQRPDASGAHLTAAPLDAAARALDGGAATPAPAPAPDTAAAGGDDTTWVPQVDEDMIDPFIDEANERLEGLAQKLLRLEEAPHDTELVRALFRDLHTVKGSSGFVGLRRMNRLAHAAEDLVGQVRDGTRAVDRPLVDALLATLDGLRAILDRAIARQPIDVDLDPLLARLRAPAAHAAGPVPAEAAHEHAAEGAPTAAAGPTRAAAKQTLRVDFDKLDLLLNLVGELVLNKASLHAGLASFGSLVREIDAQLARVRRNRRPGDGAWFDDLGRAERVLEELSHDLGATAGRLDHISSDLRDQVMKLRMLPIARVFTKYHRTVRELAHSLGKNVRLEVIGAETELDKILVEQLDDPLLHLVRNAVDHGCEPPEKRLASGKSAEATLTLSAYHRGSQIHVEVSDDGAGIEPAKLRKKAVEKNLIGEAEVAAMDDRAVLDLIFRPGFSTAARVSEVSGRGVGMDVVREAITRLKGTIDIASTPGHGTTFTLKLPLTLAIIQVLVVRVAGQDLAIPLDAVKRTLTVKVSELKRVHLRPVVMLDEQEVPLVPIALALALEGTGDDEAFPIVLVETMGELFALGCDRLVGKQEIVIKTLGDLLEEVPCAAGATLLGDRVVLILDVPQVIQTAVRRFAERESAGVPTDRNDPIPAPAGGAPRRPRILVAEDSDLIRESLKRLFENHGYDVAVARDGAEALELAQRDNRGFDAVSTDVMMPNLDGYELTRALRRDARYRAVPIIMVTARGERIDRVRGFDSGIDEYIVKPLDHSEILRAIAKHLRRP